MRLLDLFCGAGGAAMGYYWSGIASDIVGVDIKPQKRYPFEFVQEDALEYLEIHGSEFDLIHASPPCQRFTIAQRIYGREHSDLLTPTRIALNQTGLPWIIENVPQAPMRIDVMLCGSMFGLETKNGQLRRHRWFEFWKSFLFLTPSCKHGSKTISVFGHGGHIYHGVDDWRDVMGIDWMTRAELSQAIPPAYTKWIGAQLMRFL